MREYIPQNRKIKMLVSGRNKCGKTTLVRTIPQDQRILFLAIEDGLYTLEWDGWLEKNKDRIKVFIFDKKVSDISEVILSWTEDNLKDYDWIVVDSMTKINNLAEAKQAENKTKLEFNDWNIVGELGKRFYTKILSFNKNILLFAHTKVSDRGEIEFKMSGAKLKDTLPDDVDFSFYLYADKDGKRELVTSNINTPDGKLTICGHRVGKNALLDKIEPDISKFMELVGS